MLARKGYLMALAVMLTVAMVASLAGAEEHGITPPEGTVVSNTLLGDTIATLDGQLLLAWVEGIPDTVGVNQTYQTEVRLTNQVGATFTNALIVVEILKDGAPATPDDLTVESAGSELLGYDEAGHFFYYGPPTGFPIDEAYNVSTVFNNTIHNAGSYTVAIYVVDLGGGE